MASKYVVPWKRQRQQNQLVAQPKLVSADFPSLGADAKITIADNWQQAQQQLRPLYNEVVPVEPVGPVAANYDPISAHELHERIIAHAQIRASRKEAWIQFRMEKNAVSREKAACDYRREGIVIAVIEEPVEFVAPSSPTGEWSSYEEEDDMDNYSDYD